MSKLKYLFFFLEFENWVGRVDLVITNVKCHPSVRCKTIFFRLFENMSLRKSPIQLHISTMDSSHWTVFYGYQLTFPNTQRQQKNIGFESTNKHHGIMISIHFLPHTTETRIWSVLMYCYQFVVLFCLLRFLLNYRKVRITNVIRFIYFIFIKPKTLVLKVNRKLNDNYMLDESSKILII